MSITWNKPRRFLKLMLLAAVVAGCSGGDRPTLGRVTGMVTLDGRPLADAAIVFSPISGGRQSIAVTDVAGHFEMIYIRDIHGAKIGQHEVSITTAREESPRESLPARYNTETVLTAEVKSGTNDIPFKLTSEAE